VAIGRELVVARGKGLSWRYLARTYGLHRATLHRFYRAAHAAAEPFEATELARAADADGRQPLP
jgi:hypothetical protein